MCGGGGRGEGRKVRGNVIGEGRGRRGSRVRGMKGKNEKKMEWVREDARERGEQEWGKEEEEW